MQRYFKRSAGMDKVRNYITKCSRGDWFVLYQLSKNLNRAFFMDFLVTLSRTVDPESPTGNPDNIDEGDGIMDMMLKPALQTYESKDAANHTNDNDDDEDD
jgi:hypothetical protein